MVDISKALEAKSDQLNAVDLIGDDKLLKITKVDNPGGEQPVWVHYEGGEGKPWKPSKGMLRVLSFGWGTETDNWINKCVSVYCEPSVMYGGKEVGGIHISGMSDVNDFTVPLRISRNKTTTYHVKKMVVGTPVYPMEKFKAALPKMKEMMASGTPKEKIIERCNKTAPLSSEQINMLG